MKGRGILRAGLRAVNRLVVPDYRPKKKPTKTVAIVIPFYARNEFLPDEELSLRQLSHFLPQHDKFLIFPFGTTIQRDGFEVMHIPRKFFGSQAAASRLLMWPPFYKAFQDYEYIFMHHVDSLVLADELVSWCRAGWDYIGPPWLPCADTPWVTKAAVGNGGFTLMKVESVLEVFHNRHRDAPTAFWSDMITRNGVRLRPIFRRLERVQRLFPASRILNRVVKDWQVSEDPNAYGANNDFFWSYDAIGYLPTFKVAPVDEGLRFGFEAAPRMCFELNHRRLPFGGHAWAKFDRSFWEPYLVPAGTAAKHDERPAHSADEAPVR